MKVLDALDRWKVLQGIRTAFDSHWQELAERLLPKRADFTTDSYPGSKRTQEIYDSTPLQARRGLSSAVDWMLKPRNHKWFAIRTVDEDLQEDESVQFWLEDVEKRMWNAIYNPQARFIARSGEVDDDLVTFGTGNLFIARNGNNLLFRAYHLRDSWIAENETGDVDTMFLRRKITARQALQRGYTSEKITQALRDNKPETMCTYLHVVMPRNDRNPKKIDNRNMPFAHHVIDIAEEKFVEESGFEEFPFAVPRWETAAEEVYGRSPGMLALPDVKTLNEMRRTTLAAGQKAVDPPMAMPGEAVIGEPHLQPGGYVFYDPTKTQGGRNAIYPIVSGANLQLGLEMENQTREMIWGAFFRNVMQLPVDGPQMTATEILQRREEFLRVIGPTFARLEHDYIGAIVNRVFNIMLREGAFMDPPEALMGRRVDFEFRSAVQMAQKRLEAAGTLATFEQAAPLIQLNPSVLDNFDQDKIIRDMAEANGMPLDHLVGTKQVQQLREQRAQAAQMEAMAQAGERVAAAAGDAAPMVKALEAA